MLVHFSGKRHLSIVVLAVDLLNTHFSHPAFCETNISTTVHVWRLNGDSLKVMANFVPELPAAW